MKLPITIAVCFLYLGFTAQKKSLDNHVGTLSEIKKSPIIIKCTRDICYFLDGVRTIGVAPCSLSDDVISQLELITGGLPGLYGDINVGVVCTQQKHDEYVLENNLDIAPTLEKERNWQVEVFPNTTSDRLMINHGDAQDVSYELINLQGQRMASNALLNRAIIDVTQFPSGNYILRLTSSENRLVHKKIVIVH